MSPHVAWCRSRVPLNQPLNITFPKINFGGNTHDSPMLLHVESDFIILHLYSSTALPGLCLHLHLRRDPSLTLPCLWAAHLLEESKATATSRKALSELWSSRQLAANVMSQGPPLFKLFLRFLSRTIVTSHQDWSNQPHSTTLTSPWENPSAGN